MASVSVVIPVKDGGPLLSRCLEAVRSQGDVELIVIGAEPPSQVRGGGVLGGLAGGHPRELGEVTAYVLDKAPTRVLITAPPDPAAAAATAAEEEEVGLGDEAGDAVRPS